MRIGCIIAGAVAMGALCLCPCGCMVGLDLINPDLLTNMGFDVNTLMPPSGTVVVMFVNHSAGQAIFQAFEVPDLNQPSHGSRNFSVQVPPGKSDNEVLTCPLAMVGLGTLGADFASVDSSAAVIVQTTGDTGTSGSTTIGYAGTPLYSPRDFQCGDLIQVELGSDGATLTVQVIPS
jgi:hypothetical protein